MKARTRVFLLLVLTSACASGKTLFKQTALPTGCRPQLIAEASPYTTELSSFSIVGGRPLSEEEALSACAPGLPCDIYLPFNEQQFRDYVTSEAHTYEAEAVRYDKHSNGNSVVNTAILERGKLGLATKKPTVQNFYFSHLVYNGVACGTWRTEPK